MKTFITLITDFSPSESSLGVYYEVSKIDRQYITAYTEGDPSKGNDFITQVFTPYDTVEEDIMRHDRQKMMNSRYRVFRI